MSSRNNKNTRGPKTVPNDTSEVTFTNLRTGFPLSWQIILNNMTSISVPPSRFFNGEQLLCFARMILHERQLIRIQNIIMFQVPYDTPMNYMSHTLHSATVT